MWYPDTSTILYEIERERRRQTLLREAPVVHQHHRAAKSKRLQRKRTPLVVWRWALGR